MVLGGDQSRYAYNVGDRPVVLLQNGNSASAAEIFTGALHDTGKITTLGEKSFGKGIGQTIIPYMPHGTDLKITSLHYNTPSGLWPGDAGKNKIGIQPDIVVKQPEGAKLGSPEDLQLAEAVKLLKQKLAAPAHP